ncbi:MAG: DUF4340 domain-containing protein [Candidatus Aureabacteria bacterium]|nr:DUF4340 domain-containing protein [Candidatus Auribacterota bacterium]
MKTRHVLILLAVSVCLGFYILTEESKKPSRQEASISRTKVFSYDFSRVESLSVSNDRGEVSLEKSGVEWQIIKPFKYPADSTKVNKFLFDIQFSPAVRAINYDKDLAEKLGLISPSCSISISSPDSISHIDFSGIETTGDTSYGLDKNNNCIVVVEKKLIKTLCELKPDEFRTRQLIRIFPQFTDRIDFQARGEIAEFTNMGSYWKITRPFQSRCDLKAFSGLISAITSIKIDEFPDPGSIPAHMFDNSPLIIRIKPSASEKEKVFFFGPFSDDGKKMYVYQEELDTACIIDSSALKKISPEIETFRDLRLATEEAVKSDSIKISRGDSLIELTRKKNEWMLVSPAGTYNADYNAVFAFFNLFVKTEALSIEPPDEGNFPALSAKVEFACGKSAWDVSFYESGPKLYAKTPADDYFLVLDTGLKEKLYDMDFCWFVSKKVLSFPIVEISSVKIKDDKGTVTFNKNGKNRWDGNGNAASVNDLLWKLMELKAEKVLTEKEFMSSADGSEKPFLTIELCDGKKTLVLKIIRGKTGAFFAMKDGDPLVYLIQRDIIELARKTAGGD